jgi:hypothetical protein
VLDFLVGLSGLGGENLKARTGTFTAASLLGGTD